MHKLGGISCGLMIFNMAILPALLYNSETWLEVDDATIGRLESSSTNLAAKFICSAKLNPNTSSQLGLRTTVNDT